MLKCYPNPFNQQLTVEIAGSNVDGVLSVYDVVGRRLEMRGIIAGLSESRVSLDFSGRATGSYFVVLMRGHETEAKKVHLIK
ncbi:T9SS type A sorting domain-containing protein [bacterium]|nr:T9SS type A sorting domain-containing protein [bacterium]